MVNMTGTSNNPYLKMLLDRVRQDAVHGVSLARRALAERDPASARAMGIGVESNQQRQ